MEPSLDFRPTLIEKLSISLEKTPSLTTISGRIWRILAIRAINFLYETGITRLENSNAPILSIILRTMTGFMILNKEIPAAFMASNSLFSPMSPKVMIEASNMESGSAIGISMARV